MCCGSGRSSLAAAGSVPMANQVRPGVVGMTLVKLVEGESLELKGIKTGVAYKWSAGSPLRFVDNRDLSAVLENTELAEHAIS